MKLKKRELRRQMIAFIADTMRGSDMDQIFGDDIAAELFNDEEMATWVAQQQIRIAARIKKL